MSEKAEGKAQRAGAEERGRRFSGRVHSHFHTFRTPWDRVAQALWQRYPNPYSKHVLSEDVLSRQIQGQRLSSRRLLRKTNSAPKWLERFVGGKGASASIVEESVVDMATKTFTTYTRNINFSKLMSVEEKAVYYVSPENDEWTCCKKDAWITCKVRGISLAVEKFGIDRYRRNAQKAHLGLEFVIGKLFIISSPLLASTARK